MLVRHFRIDRGWHVETPRPIDIIVRDIFRDFYSVIEIILGKDSHHIACQYGDTIQIGNDVELGIAHIPSQRNLGTQLKFGVDVPNRYDVKQANNHPYEQPSKFAQVSLQQKIAAAEQLLDHHVNSGFRISSDRGITDVIYRGSTRRGYVILEVFQGSVGQLHALRLGEAAKIGDGIEVVVPPKVPQQAGNREIKAGYILPPNAGIQSIEYPSPLLAGPNDPDLSVLLNHILDSDIIFRFIPLEDRGLISYLDMLLGVTDEAYVIGTRNCIISTVRRDHSRYTDCLYTIQEEEGSRSNQVRHLLLMHRHGREGYRIQLHPHPSTLPEIPLKREPIGTSYKAGLKKRLRQRR